ncbi:helicase [Desmophyllum pertusum]|uniref:Helicase n=1 Tax=Desmophyllum pertusum TaxID=174260 RepID=A0A9W9ZAZ5_9CNID|nr:helicase [Desmophyllum pertusum]
MSTEGDNPMMLELFHYSLNVPRGLLERESCVCTVEIIKQPIPLRRMIKTLTKLPEEGLAHDICLGNTAGLDGTGKTITGVHIAYWFARRNSQRTEALPQVLYCGPSNKSVDVVAEYLMKNTDLKILRVYGSLIEQEEFPIPNQVKPTRPIASQEELRVPENLRGIALHHVIRDEEKSPQFAKTLKKYETYFARMKKKMMKKKKKKKKNRKVKDSFVKEYLKVIKKAKIWAIKNHVQIVLCTCSAAGSAIIKRGCRNVIQCIVDECGNVSGNRKLSFRLSAQKRNKLYSLEITCNFNRS